MPTIELAGTALPVKPEGKTGVAQEYANQIATGTPARSARLLQRIREEGASGYPLGLGYSRGPLTTVLGGLRKGELRVEIPGQVSLPLVMTSQTIAAGDLSGEVAAAGRIAYVNTALGNSSGKRRLYVTAGTKLLRTVSDTDFSLENSTYIIITGADRFYCCGTIYLNNLQYFYVGTEAPTAASAMQVTANPTATPPVFSAVTPGAANLASCYWAVSVDRLSRTYAHVRNGNELLVYWAYSDALAAAYTTGNVANALKKGDQCLGVDEDRLRIWLLTPVVDAETLPGATKTLKYIDLSENHTIVTVTPRTRTVIGAFLGDHWKWGKGVFYWDGHAFYWTNGRAHNSLGWGRGQGRTTARSIRGAVDEGDRIGAWVQMDDASLGQWEVYIPRDNEWGGSWYPSSKDITTTALTILPGGSTNGSQMPYGDEGLRRYVINPAAVNSTFWRQLEYPTPDQSNPLTTSIGVDTFEDGPLTFETPLYDGFGGPEELGAILQVFLEGWGLSASSTVQWEYTTDQITYTSIGTYTAADTATIIASGGGTQRRLGFRCTLNHSAGSTASPNGGTLVITGLKQPKTHRVWEYVIDAAQMSEDDRVLLTTDLLTWRNGGVPVRLIAGEVDTYVYVEAFTVRFRKDVGDADANAVPFEVPIKLAEVTA